MNKKTSTVKKPNGTKPPVSGALPYSAADSERKLNEYALRLKLDYTKPNNFALGWRLCFEWLAGRQ